MFEKMQNQPSHGDLSSSFNSLASMVINRETAELPTCLSTNSLSQLSRLFDATSVQQRIYVVEADEMGGTEK